MNLANVPQRLALAALLTACPLFADFRDDIGYPELLAEFGSSIPNGSNVAIAQVEYVRDGTWAPEGAGELSGKTITYSPSTPSVFSYHGNEVGRVFYGSQSSLIPAAGRIHAFEAWDYFDNSLETAKGTAPQTPDWDVENHSYISNAGFSSNEGSRRLDYRIDHDGVTATVVLENGTGTVPPLFGNTYNAIVVGSSTGNHSRGGTTRDLAGRLKPDIVGTANYTSYAGPIVGTSAGLLIAKTKSDSTLSSAKRPETIKAMLMAGATKDEFPSWSRTASAPLDPVFGAGEVNIFNSYRILLAGRQQASSSVIRDTRGWDLNSVGTGGSLQYYFTIGEGQTGTVSAVLTWNRSVTPINGAWNQGILVSVDNYDLRLYRTNAQLQKGDLLQDSISSIDNVEHIYLENATAGTYLLEVTSVSGSKQFGLAWTVLGVEGGVTPPPAPTPPTIVTQPAAAAVTAGTAASFGVEVSGTSPFTYQWKKDGVAIPGANSSTLSIASASSVDTGTYTVQVTNNAGSALSTGAFLTVNPAVSAPSIVSQPQAASAYVGGSATFSVEASGTAPFAYQWRKDGVAILGADSGSLSLSNLSLTDAGTYSVVVANPAGSVASTGAYLTVTDPVKPPSIETQPKSADVTEGAITVFSVTASGTGPLNFQWRKNGAQISGATSSGYTITSAKMEDAATYTVVVSNSAGQVVSSGAVLTVHSAPASVSSGKLGNISSRSKVGTGSEILISGFVLSGTKPKTLLVRAVGPGLSQFGLHGLLARPKIQIFAGPTLIADIPAGSRVPSLNDARFASQFAGAFSLPDDSADTVVVRSFDPGAYTVQVSGEGGGTGIAIVEIYDLDGGNTASQVVNLSTRSVVGRDGEILIPGVVVTGSTPRQLLIRAVGPGLKQWGVDGTLQSPKIALYQGSTPVMENTGWSTSANAGEIAAVSARVGAFALKETDADSALLVTLPPGAYTLHVSGADGGTGVVLAEIFEVP